MTPTRRAATAEQYSGPGWHIYRGESVATLRALASAGLLADAIVSDPPFFLSAKSTNNGRSHHVRSLVDLSMVESFYKDWFAACAALLRPDGVWYLFCDGQSYPLFYTMIHCHVRRQRPLIWDKLTSVNGYSWRHQHELILFGEGDEAPAIKTGDGDILRYRAVPAATRRHPAQKPDDLIERLIVKSVPEGGLVVDPFSGSGATGVAALRSGRRFVGIERERRHCASSAAWLST